MLEPWAGNPLLARLEANRVYHLAEAHVQLVAAVQAQQRLARRDAVLERLLESSAFGLAERLSARCGCGWAIGREHAAVSKADDPPRAGGLAAAQPLGRRGGASGWPAGAAR